MKKYKLYNTRGQLMHSRKAGSFREFIEKLVEGGADLRGADLKWADLREADLREADLREADLREADLREADLKGADLKGADLREADLREADLRGADLKGADLDFSSFPLSCNGTNIIAGERLFAQLMYHLTRQHWNLDKDLMVWLDEIPIEIKDLFKKYRNDLSD